MHGTGTALGDPIEFGAAVSALGTAHRTMPGHCITALSAKASIGHSEAAAGMMGLLHALASLLSSTSPGKASEFGQVVPSMTKTPLPFCGKIGC